MAYSKNRRCKWYNEVGWGRINPKAKIKKGSGDFIGCQFGDSCFYLHPGNPGWADAPLAEPYPAEYPDGIRPPTPEPPSSRSRTPERGAKVKAEHESPKLSLEDTKRVDNRNERSASRSVARSPSPGPGNRDMHPGRIQPFRTYRKGPPLRSSRSRSRERRYNQDGRRGRDWDYDRGRRRDYDGRERDYRARERSKERRDFDRERERDRDGPSHSSIRPDRGTPQNINDSTRRGAADDDYTSGRPSYTARDNAALTTRRPTPTGPSFEKRRASQSHTERASLSAQNSFELAPAPRPFNLTHGATDTSSNTALSGRSTPVQPPPDSSVTSLSFASQTTAQPPPDSAVSQTSITSEMPPPPPPPALAAPPLPPLPESSNAGDTNEKTEKMSFQERIKVWDHRIELLMQATTARQKQKTLSADIQMLRTLTTGNRFTGLSLAARENILASLKDAEARCETAKNFEDAAVEKIYKADFWPVRKRPEDAEGDNAGPEAPNIKLEEEHELMKTEVSDLDAAVRRMDHTLKEVLAFIIHRDRSASATPTTKFTTFGRRPSEDVDMKDAIRAPKRRRLDDEDEKKSDVSRTAGPSTPTIETQVERPSTPPISVDAVEVQKILRRLADLESQVSEFDNISNQMDDALQAFVDDRVDTRIEELRHNVRKHQAEAISTLRNDVDQMGEEIAEISSEMGGLITRQKEATDQLETQKQVGEKVWNEMNEMKASMERERARANELEVQLQACMQETRALASLVQTIKRESPPPYTPSVDDIVQYAKPVITVAVREDILDVMKEWRNSITASLKENSTSHEQIELLREKMEKIRRIPNVLQSYERQNQQK